MNLGQALGELHLRISTLEERRGKGAAVADTADLQAEIAAARTGETKALLLLAQERKVREQVEAQASRAIERIASMERRTHRDPGDAALIADLEARLRGKDQQLADVGRKLADALGLASKRQQEIDELLKQPAKIVEVPTPADCPVCKAIKLMVLGVEPRPSSHLPRTVIVHATSLRSRMQEALERAAAPLTAEEIGDAADISPAKVETNIWHLVRAGIVVRLGSPGGHGRKAGRYRYWLASRPLPQQHGATS